MNCINSPINEVLFNDYRLFIKRDDLLSKEFSGNKARKFHYFLDYDYSNIDKLISYGSAQANSLYSLSCLAKLKDLKLDFYVKHISSYLKDNPEGNYKQAINNGANIIESKDANDIHEYVQNNILPKENKYLFLEEGGRIQEASHGLKILADEIITWAKENDYKNVNVFLPSGTGTTALFLQKFLPFEVLTCSCVGGEEYLKKQFYHLNKNEEEHPSILYAQKKYHFGKLYKEFYEIHQELLSQTSIEFELLYDPLGFITMLEYLKTHQNKNDINLYIHQGGTLGNESMIKRYKRKFENTRI